MKKNCHRGTIRGIVSLCATLLITSSLFAGTTSADKSRSRDQNSKQNDISTPKAGWHPYLSVVPAKFWDCRGVLHVGDRNDLGLKDPNKGAQYHLLCQSVAGLTHRAVQQKKLNVGIWMGAPSIEYGYEHSFNTLQQMGVGLLGTVTAVDLTTKEFAPVDGIEVGLKGKFDGYVLTDVERNPESNVVASVASHVYNSIIVDVRDQALYDAAGYKMTYDATQKTTRDSWREFRDKCKNNALVLMPVQTGELREFAIANDLFVINLNHVYADSTQGDNFELFKEVLTWLKPNSPVYGWDQGIDENKIANHISEYGNHSVPYDWGYNTTMTAVNYPARQDYAAKTIDPRKIDYALDKKFVSFYLSDGDNVQWMMGGFDYWYRRPQSAKLKMTYGMAVANTAMIGPAQMASLFKQQDPAESVFERSSYFFLDTYACKKDRPAFLKALAEAQAAHMKRHNVKLLGMVSLEDVDTPESMEGFQAMISANDELEGIISIQYSPYADGQGRTFWFKNSKGHDIPVVCTKYSIWNCGKKNHAYEGTPAFIARKLKTDPAPMSKFSLICIHCWSRFYDKGVTTDEIAENIIKDGKADEKIPFENPEVVFSAGAAELCANRLGPEFEIVNAQELIWRIRMDHNPVQTKQILKKMK